MKLIRQASVVFVLIFVSIGFHGSAQTLDSIFYFDNHDSGDFFLGNSMTAPNGDIILCARIYGRVDFDFGPSENKINEPSNKLRQVIRYDKEFNYQWHQTFYGDLELHGSLATSSSIFLSRTFEGTVVFDPDPNNTVTRNAGILRESIFLLELDQNGNFVHVLILQGLNSYSYFLGNYPKLDVLPFPDGSIIVTGNLEDSIDIHPGSPVIREGGYTDSYVSNITAFALKLDTDWNYVKHLTFSPNLLETKNAFHFSFYGGSLFLSGQFDTTLYPSLADPAVAVSPSVDGDFVIIRFDTGLQYQNHQFLMKGNGTKYFGPVVPGENGTFYLMGGFIGSVSAVANGGNFSYTSSTNYIDALILKFDTSNQFKAIGTYWLSTAFGERAKYGCHIDENLLIHIGMGSGTATGPSPDFDPGPDTVLVDKRANSGQAYLLLDKNLEYLRVGSTVSKPTGDYEVRSFIPQYDTSLVLLFESN